MLAAAHTPTIYIKPEAKAKMEIYTKLCDQEISGLGIVVPLGDDLLIKDILLFKQKVGPGSTDLEQEDISALMVDCAHKDIEVDDLKLWWHSHVNMGVYWSGTDHSTADIFDEDMTWNLSIVTNKKKECRVRLDFYSPVRATLDDLPLVIYDEKKNTELEAELKAEIKEKVTVTRPVYVNTYYEKYLERQAKKREEKLYGGLTEEEIYGDVKDEDETDIYGNPW